MSQAPKVRARPAVVGSVTPTIHPFAATSAAASRLLIDVRHTRHETVEFVGNTFFNDLCGQIVREEAVLLAGAPGSNKSTLARQLTLDLVDQGHRALMILTEESAERAKAGFVNMAGQWPQSKVRAALSNSISASRAAIALACVRPVSVSSTKSGSTARPSGLK